MIRYKNLLVKKESKRQLVKAFNNFLDSGFYLNGKQTEILEKKIAKFCKRKYCILTSSGTNSLYLAIRSLNLSKNDEILCPNISWIATSAIIKFLNIKIKFIDVNYDQNINPYEIEKNIGKNTKAIIFVNFTGQLAEFNKIKIIAKKYQLYTIEDAAQSFGASKKNNISGNLADISTFSFNPMKVLQGFGEMGAVITNNKKIYTEINEKRHLGLSLKNKEKLKFLDLNHKPDEIQSYLLNVSLKKFKNEIKHRAKMIERYKKNLNGKIIYWEHNTKNSSCYDYQILVKKRNQLMNYLFKNGVETKIKHPYLLSEQNIYSNMEINTDTPVAKFIVSKKLSLPLHSRITEKDVDKISNLIINFYSSK